MAKEIKGYIDPSTKIEYPVLYCQVDNILLNYRAVKVVIVLGWYASKEAADDGQTMPVRTESIIKDGDDAEGYFKTSDLRPAAEAETNDREEYAGAKLVS